MKSVNATTYMFIMQQVRTQHQKPRARRFTLEEKILCLTLFKSSGKAYRLLSKIFCLPSIKTLTNLLNNLPYQPGINKHVFHSLKETIKNIKNANDRLCIIVFDEIFIRPLLTYNSKLDVIQGVEDDGTTRTARIADHANVFMIKGIQRQWKQAVSFTFSKGPITSSKLKPLIVQIIRECLNIGLDVVAIVCDQGGANQAAINSLLNDTREWCLSRRTENTYCGFVVEDRAIIPLYDDLFKGMRNNLLNKDVHYIMNDQTHIASWEHIKQFYFLDKFEDTRLCPKLHDGHIFPNKMNKMKVSTMAQVFSYTVGSLMKRICKWDTKSEYNLPEEAEHTAEFILFLDELFDSLNGNTKTPPQSKPLRGGVSMTSPHEQFWWRAVAILETVYFYNVGKRALCKVPSAINLIKTIKGFIYLSRRLLQKVHYILPRAVNQDCLENFFASLRGHARYNTLPDVGHFTSSFKALVVNNFLSRHSPGANCEDDSTVGALDNLRYFLTGEYIAGTSIMEPLVPIELPALMSHWRRRRVAKATIAYVSGYIGRRVLNKFKNCESCKALMTHSDGNVPLEIIEARQYQKSHLVKPGSYLYFAVSEALTCLFYLLPRHCHMHNIKVFLDNILTTSIDFNVLKCVVHPEVPTFIKHFIIRTVIYFWIKRVNKVLGGRDEKFLLLLKSKPNTSLIDPIKLEAHNMYLKKRKSVRNINK